jgi:hypothetical protein
MPSTFDLLVAHIQQASNRGRLNKKQTRYNKKYMDFVFDNYKILTKRDRKKLQKQPQEKIFKKK